KPSVDFGKEMVGIGGVIERKNEQLVRRRQIVVLGNAWRASYRTGQHLKKTIHNSRLARTANPDKRADPRSLFAPPRAQFCKLRSVLPIARPKESVNVSVWRPFRRHGIIWQLLLN